MRRRRTSKYIALLVPSALFIACAADPGDVSKLNETSTGLGNTGSNTGSNTSPATQGDTGQNTGGNTGQNTGSTTGTQTSNLTTSTTGTSTGNSTGTGGNTSTVTSTSTATTTAADAAAEAAPPCTTCTLTLAYRTPMPGDGVTSVAFDVQVTNSGTGNQDLTQLTIQYYFTADGASGLNSSDTQINQASITTAGPPYYQTISGVSLNFSPLSPTTSTADTVATLSFASGSLPAGGVLEVDAAFHSSGYATTFTESNDYSYTGTDTTTFAPTQTITIQVAGVTVWGMAP